MFKPNFWFVLTRRVRIAKPKHQ